MPANARTDDYVRHAPGHGVADHGTVPNQADDPVFAKALEYMGMKPGEQLIDKPIKLVFVGSCTNSRLSDLELAARVLKGHKVAPGVRMLVVPGSQQIKREAEARGLDRIFLDAGAEWRESGCSMCIGMNGDTAGKGQYAVSTSNRNFEGRQGAGRTHVAGQSGNCRGGGHPWPHHGSPRVPVNGRRATHLQSRSKLHGSPCNPSQSLKSRTVVLPSTDIDTDQIIPARFLRTTTKEGLGKQLFADWRYDASGSPKTRLHAEQPEAQGAAMLVAGHNFGCGSSREHAPWALLDFGFRAVISTEIADIFRSNASRTALLPMVIDEATHAWLIGESRCRGGDRSRHHHADSCRMASAMKFPIEAFARYCLLNGIDELGYLLNQSDAISRHERVHHA